ncbi:hypothetical protein KIW84_063246 [Lathyrus oleraceus]|uniref:GAGA-binding transcriptional activator n=1 Tax=Pisum sativum TaxID=3888 RepID=A0A9D5A9D8_PEA|nr:hypothetical protein KIW84_063246 [Pisum sativum]
MSSCPPGCQISRGVKYIHHLPQQVNHLPTMGDSSYGTRELPTSNAFPESPIPSEVGNPPRRAKRPKETLEWKSSQEIINESDELTKQLAVSKADWKPQDLALNQVAYDDSTTPAPVCSCTGILR